MAGLLAAPGGGGRHPRAPAGDLRAPPTAGVEHRGVPGGRGAVRDAAGARGPPSRDQRGRAHGLPRRDPPLLHLLARHVRGVPVQPGPRAVRQAVAGRPAGAIPGADGDVVAVLPVAVVARRAGAHPAAQSALAVLMLALALAGAHAHWRHDRQAFWYFGTLMLTVSVVLVYYLNFRYGASQAPDLGEDGGPRGARPRLLLRLELFPVWRLGRARRDAADGVGDAPDGDAAPGPPRVAAARCCSPWSPCSATGRPPRAAATT